MHRKGVTAHDLLRQRSGKIVSTDAVAWPDGRATLLLYIRAEGFLFRCVDETDSSLQGGSSDCYRLGKPKKR